jgi:hypothetical protein
VDDESKGLESGADRLYCFDVTNDDAEIKSTVAWTDYPATIQSSVALVNDIDLVAGPDPASALAGNLKQRRVSRGTAFAGCQELNFCERCVVCRTEGTTSNT